MRWLRLSFAFVAMVGCASVIGIEDTTDEPVTPPERDGSVEDSASEDASSTGDGASTEVPVLEDASTFADVADIDAQVTTCGESGLVARWKLDEGAGTVVADCSGNKLHGIATKGTWTSNGADGGALQFAGDGWVGFGNAGFLRFTGAFTISMWLRSNSNTAETEYLFGKTSDPVKNGYRLALLGHAPNEIVLATPSSASNFNVTGGNVPNGSWRHLAAVYRPSVATEVYMSGTKVGTNNGAPAALVASNAEARLGARVDGLYGFTGAVSDVRVYNRALTAAEITTLSTR